MSSTLKTVPISSIRENIVALRGVDKEDPQYLTLRNSIAKHGVQSPITVREKQDEEGNTVFEIVDGLHRYSGSVDLGLESIDVKVISASDAEQLELQIAGNLHRVDTKPAEYSQQLKRMFSLNPTMTMAEMAEKCCQSPAWVNQRLSLNKLTPEVAKVVDDGDITLSNAYSLAKLPKEEQANYIEQAMTMQPGEFAPTVQARVKELRDAAKQGREANPQTFTPIAHIRKVGDIKTEVEKRTIGPDLVAALNATTGVEGFYVALNWVMSLDPASVAKQEAEYNARNSKRDEEKKANALARADKKLADAQAKAAEVRAAAGVS